MGPQEAPTGTLRVANLVELRQWTGCRSQPAAPGSRLGRRSIGCGIVRLAIARAYLGGSAVVEQLTAGLGKTTLVR